jgi:hypothetical protein
MMKRVLQDVVEQKRSIREIPIKGKKTADYVETFKIESEPKEAYRRPVFEAEPPRKITRYVLWGIGVVAVFLVFYFATDILARATLTITPYAKSYDQSTLSLVAKKSVKTGDVSFDTLTLEDTVYVESTSTGEKLLQEKASGTITVYNDLTTAQSLVKNTRFESPTGKIFRIPTGITIPKKTVTGPGSITVKVTADDFGPEYNIEPGNFTIPGFKTSPDKYQKVYAKSTAPMKGGINTKSPTASKEDVERASITAQATLKTRLNEKMTKSIPQGYVFYPSLSGIEYEDVPNKPSTEANNKVFIGQKGIISGVILNEKELTSAIARKLQTPLDPGSVKIADLEDLQITVLETGAIWKRDTLNLGVRGKITLISTISEEKIKQAIKGKSEGDLEPIIKDFPEIAKVTSSISPIWKMSFPSNISKINIINSGN